MVRFLWVVSLLLALVSSEAFGEDTRTGIFAPDFHTLTVSVDGNPLAAPVLLLDGSNTLTIGFDQLGDDRQYLRYTLVHCNSDWQPSLLTDSELFDSGFNYGDVADYAFSRGTSVHYVHYSITLPNEEYRFLVSGNYLVRVYPEDDPDNILLQARFMVSEAAVAVRGQAVFTTDVDYRDRHQQLELVVDAPRVAVADPFNDLTVVISQNYRPDRVATLHHPSRVEGTRAIYEHLQGLLFPAGNEYRRMETVSTTYPGMGVDYIDFVEPYYHHVLSADKPRFGRSYQYDETQKGRFLIRSSDAANSDTEADYTVVHFALDLLPVPGAEIYIEGDLTNRRLDGDSRMRFNPERGLYERALLLKQGSYNYQYVAIPAQPDALPEGNYYQTLNHYFITVYYRRPGDRYDRLLSTSLIQ